MRDKVLHFRKDAERDVEGLLRAAEEENFDRAVILGRTSDGYWFFRCTAGIDKIEMAGMLEFLKEELFHSMGSMPWE